MRLLRICNKMALAAPFIPYDRLMKLYIPKKEIIFDVTGVYPVLGWEYNWTYPIRYNWGYTHSMGLSIQKGGVRYRHALMWDKGEGLLEEIKRNEAIEELNKWAAGRIFGDPTQKIWGYG